MNTEAGKKIISPLKTVINEGREQRKSLFEKSLRNAPDVNGKKSGTLFYYSFWNFHLKNLNFLNFNFVEFIQISIKYDFGNIEIKGQ
jgi:hypothetical protein